ncbi:MAG: hypothetical protein KKG75_03285 [Nanoarchaeota archaeon]|nr:hypothetical protein [Nanoarchaeota archaeon]
MVQKEVVDTRIIKVDDKKLLLVVGVVIVLAALVSGNLTGNAGRVSIFRQLDYNEFVLNEGGVKFFKGAVVKLDVISENNAAVVDVVTETKRESRIIQAGHRVYINGFFVTNIATNYQTKVATLRVE